MVWPKAPLIIPLTALVVVAVAVILLIFHFFRRLLSKSHQKPPLYEFSVIHKKSSDPLPSSPYSIDASHEDTTASSSSIYFVKGHSMLYPPLVASAPSQSPSPRLDRNDDRGERQQMPLDDDELTPDQIFTLDTVDDGEQVLNSSSSPASNSTREENRQLLTISERGKQFQNDDSDSNRAQSAMSFEYQRESHFRQETQSEYNESTTTGGITNNFNNEQHYESDV